MDTSIRFTGALLAVLFVFVPFAHGQVTAPTLPLLPAGMLSVTPDKLVFNAMDKTERVLITRDGTPVPVSEIGAPQLWADGHSYAYMLLYTKVESEPGVLLISPNPERCEIGSYDLRIPVGKETVSIQVETPLKTIKNVVEQETAKTGKSAEEVSLELGLSKNPGREKLEVSLAPEYQAGQVLSLNLGDAPDRHYVWTINGVVVLEGQGKSALEYTFPAPGDYTLHVTESKDGVRIAQTTAKTLVRESAIEWTVAPQTPVVFPGPKGYGQYQWKIDGRDAGSGQDFRHTFDAPGDHQVECAATQPTEAGRPAERRLTWSTHVK